MILLKGSSLQILLSLLLLLGPSTTYGEECPKGTFEQFFPCEICCPEYTDENCKDCDLVCQNGDDFGSYCKECDVGTYNDEIGFHECRPCEKGYYAEITGSSQCSQCPFPLTTFFDEGNQYCTICREGYFMRYGNDDKKLPTIFDLNNSPTYYCQECPPYGNCTDGTTIANMTIQPGYWRASNYTSSIYQCNYPSVCDGTSCSFGHTGPLCEGCIDDGEYFDRVDGKCKSCETSYILILLLLGIPFVLLLLIVSFYLWHMGRLNTLSNTIRSINIHSKLKILVGFYQIMSAFKDVYGITIHPDMQQVFRYFTYVFSFEFLPEFPLECVASVKVAYIITGIWPYLLVFGFGVLNFIWKKLKKYSNALNSKNTEARITMAEITLVTFYIVLPTVSKQIFLPLRCQFYDDRRGQIGYLVSYNTVQCDPWWWDMTWDTTYSFLVKSFFIFITLWPCLTLLGLFVIVTRLAKSVRIGRPNLFAKKFTFLWADFDQNSSIAIYWDIVDSVRKVFLLGFINFFDIHGSNKLLKLSIGTAISSLYSIILLYVRPYKRNDDFHLAILSSYFLTLAFASSHVLEICKNEDDEDYAKYYFESYEEYKYSDLYEDHEDNSCRRFYNDSFTWYGASAFVIAIMSGMLFATVATLIFQSRFSPIVRLRSTGYPPNLNLPEDCDYHVFMSHKWKGGQDKCHSIARKLQLYMTELKVWLDVDNLSSTDDLEQSVKESAVFLLCYSRGYFESKNCRREFFQALHLNKPIIVVYDGTDSELSIMNDECKSNCENNPDGLELWNENMWKEKLSNFLTSTFEGDNMAIQWLKCGNFSSESLKLIYLRIIKELPYYKDEVGSKALDKGLLMPCDGKTQNIKFPVDILVSSFNPGSYEIANEIKTLSKNMVTVVDMNDNEISNDEENYKCDLEPFTIQLINSEQIEEDYETWSGVVPGCFTLENLTLKESKKTETVRASQKVTDSKEWGQILTDTPLRMNQESRRLLRPELESKKFKVFLLYLNKDTFGEKAMAKIGPILQAIIEQKIPIITVHEQDHKKGAEPNFDYFLKNTPEKFMSVYQDIATPIYTQKEYRHVSLCCIIKKIIEKHDELK